MVTKTKPTSKKVEKEPEPNLEGRTDIEIVRDSLGNIRESIGISNSIALLPYMISFEGHEDEYFLGITNWELDGRIKQDSNRDPLRAYSALGSGFVIPEENPKKIYGHLMGNKAFTSPLLVNRIVIVPQHPYGNYSRSLRLQLESSSAYRNDVPENIASWVRKGFEVSLKMLKPDDLEVIAKKYNK